MSQAVRASMALLALLLVPAIARADDEAVKKLEKSLEAAATVEKKLWVPMRDGVRLSTDLYRPKAAQGPLPTIFWRTPYDFTGSSERMLKLVQKAVDRGYAFVIQNERGKFFSEGEWEILGFPRTDGVDALDWIAAQQWSNGKVGTIGCSSSAEWQLALAAMDHPAHAAMIPMSAGAGIGRVKPYWEQGNWYRGGVFQMLFYTWLYGVQNTQRPTFPPDLSNEDLVRLSKYFDLAPRMPDVDWQKALRHLPLVDMMENVGGPKGMFAEFVRRTPDDPAWYRGGLYQDDEPWGVPALWFDSWYDVSIGPNLALFNHVTHNATDPEVAGNQYVVIAPTPHCGFFVEEEETIVGERDMGDVRLDSDALIFGWFDRWLKGEANGFAEQHAKVQYFLMGANEWRQADSWPPAGAAPVTWHLDSGGKANSLFGDGRLVREAPGADRPDTFPSDPQNPVPSLGGGVCCIGGAVAPGSFDQRPIEARHDVLVYTSDPLEEAVEVSGFIDVTLWISSDARDSDFAVKLIDVYPDGTAYNLDDTIQRARYRDGYDRQALMSDGGVYELRLSPMATSNRFEKGHRIRLEIAGSNFPRYARNLNTGGNNWDETEGVVAHSAVHHSKKYPSRVVLPVVRPRD